MTRWGDQPWSDHMPCYGYLFHVLVWFLNCSGCQCQWWSHCRQCPQNPQSWCTCVFSSLYPFSLSLLYPQKPICGVFFYTCIFSSLYPSLSHSALSSKTNLWCIVFAPFSPTNQKSYCSGFSHYVPAFHVTFITHSSPSLFTSLTAIDSVWAVYILPEEVGSRIQALGMQYLTLQSALSSKTMATLKIISPLDMEPIVTWEATKMRRTGNLNNMMFIEIGRRCEGGPGLIWMCTTPADTHNFRETLQRLVCGCE